MTAAALLKKIRRFLGSVRLTISLIVALGICFLLGLWIPQKGILQYEDYLQWKTNVPGLVAFIEAMGFMEIYKSPLMLFIWGCFFVNLAFVMWARVPHVRTRVALPEHLPDPHAAAFPHKVAVSLPVLPTIDQIRLTLKQKHFTVHGTSQRFYGVRNRFSPVASLLFHFSFFLILLGGVITIYTRFVGQVDLAEGEAFKGAPSHYNAPPLIARFAHYPVVDVVIRKITPRAQNKTHTGLQVIMEDRSRTHEIDINRPYRRGNVSLVIKDLGLAPLVVMRDSSGKELDGAFVKLDVFRGKEDGFRMGPYEFRARFFADHELVGGEDRSRSEELRNPVLLLRIKGQDATTHRIPCMAGTSLRLDNLSLHFPQFSYWVRFSVVSEKGLFLVYSGFLVACIALFWRLVLYRRELAGSVETGADGPILHLAFRSEFYRALAEEEVEQLGNFIRNRLADRSGSNESSPGSGECGGIDSP